MPDTVSLVTIARARLAPELSDIPEATLSVLILAASLLVERYCNRNFVDQTYTDEAYDGDEASTLLLRHFPITATVALVVMIIENDDTEVPILAAEFRQKARTGLIAFRPNSTAAYNYFPRGFQNIEVTYSAGHVTVPELVQEACVQLVGWLLTKAREDEVASESMGDYSISYAKEAMFSTMPVETQALLTTYRDIHS